jgi:DNA-binding PadR family transcriptional regulator
LSITSDLIRGHTETIILSHLCVKESYGYEINKSIQEKSSGGYELKEATLYGAFRRLEESGAIQSYWGDETTGARRRYYRITDRGRQLYRESLAEWRTARSLINKLIRYENPETTHETEEPSDE